jgi:hypothetical protein
MQTALASAQVRATPHGWMLVRHENSADEQTLILDALVGDPSGFSALASAARAEAAYRGFSGVQAILADTPALNAALAQAGYICDGGMLICEQILE